LSSNLVDGVAPGDAERWAASAAGVRGRFIERRDALITFREAHRGGLEDLQRIRGLVRENRISFRIPDGRVLAGLERRGRGWIAEADGEAVGFIWLTSRMRRFGHCSCFPSGSGKDWVVCYSRGQSPGFARRAVNGFGSRPGLEHALRDSMSGWVGRMWVEPTPARYGSNSGASLRASRRTSRAPGARAAGSVDSLRDRLASTLASCLVT
jgi:hypothetical protein